MLLIFKNVIHKFFYFAIFSRNRSQVPKQTQLQNPLEELHQMLEENHKY